MTLPSKKVDIVALRGGIDLASPFVQIQPGAALDLLNYEPELEGGYRRIAGYERLDGQAAPRDAVYYTLEVNNSEISVGATITGGTSGATAKVIEKDGTTLGITAYTGTFVVAESLGLSTVVSVPELDGQSELETADEWQLAAENHYRALIDPVPGEGNVLGAVHFDGDTYAFREDAGTVKLYRTSSSGWDLVPFFRVMFFDAGVLAEGDVADGDTVTGLTSAATGTVKAFVKNAGVYGSTASGYIVIDVTAGTFQDNEAIQKAAVTQFTSASTANAITLDNDGHFEFIIHNFFGGVETRYLYGCDGVNPAWQFDGETLVPIYFPAPDTNASWNTPTFLQAHKTHLFLMVPGGQMAHSSVGEPLVFSVRLGAGVFGLGDECTGMAQRSGDVLALYTRNRTFGLYGSAASGDDAWTLKIISETFGAKAYTVQKIGTVYACEDKGIAPLERVDAYGDFESATVSRFVTPILQEYKDRIIGSVVVKSRNQYRLFFDDGSGLIMGDDQYLGETLPAFSTFRFTHIPTCMSSSEAATGDEIILFGDEDGYVYQMEVGYNFDGGVIDFVYRSPFMAQKSPHVRKTYRKLFLDLDTNRAVRLSLAAELSYSDYYTAHSSIQNIAISGGGGYYDLVDWDEFYYDAVTYATAGIPLYGTGNNTSILIYGSSATTRPFTIQTLELHYLLRRMKRA